MSAEQELLRRLQAALRDADSDAAALVDEAREAARAEVREVLRRTMAHDLLRRALEEVELTTGRSASTEHLGPEPPPSPEPPVPPEPSDPPEPPDPTDRSARAADRAAEQPSPVATVVYVFGIGRSGTHELDEDLPRLPGGGPVRSVDRHGLRALVADLEVAIVEELQDPSPAALDTLAAAATAHDTVLATVASRVPVVPFRLGTVVDDDVAMADVLDRHAAALHAELDRFDGRTEWAVTVQLLARAAADGAPHGPSGPSAAGDGAAYLRERQAAVAARRARIERRERLTDDVHTRLSEVAVGASTVERRDRDGVPPRQLHGVYLLDAERVESFHRIVDELRAEHPEAIIEASGPWPPYHFTAVRLDDPGRGTVDAANEAS